MPAPQNVREVAPAESAWGGSYTRACEGAAFHSPTPLRTFPYAWGDGEQVWLCPTCEDNLSVLLGLIYDAAPEPLGWPIRREFGNKIRAIATKVTHG